MIYVAVYNRSVAARARSVTAAARRHRPKVMRRVAAQVVYCYIGLSYASVLFLLGGGPLSRLEPLSRSMPLLSPSLPQLPPPHPSPSRQVGLPLHIPPTLRSHSVHLEITF